MKSLFIVLSVSVLFLGGCASTNSSKVIDQTNTILNKNGVPSSDYLIGNGVEVTFVAPTDGHVYLIEERSKQGFIVSPLEKGDEYSYDIKHFANLDTEEKALLRNKGIDPDNMNVSVYFVPVKDMFKKQKQSAFNEKGLPKQEYYIGGGFTFNFTPQEDGMIYLVEQNSGTFVLTQTMKADESLNESIDPANNSLKNRFEALGIDTNNMQFGLYFVPTN